jgi:hypothetical protein
MKTNIQGGIIDMNTDARNNMHMCKEALQKAQKGLEDAATQVENTNIKNQITEQLDQVKNCLDGCQRISSGLSQYLTEKKVEGIHH